MKIKSLGVAALALTLSYAATAEVSAEQLDTTKTKIQQLVNGGLSLEEALAQIAADSPELAVAYAKEAMKSADANEIAKIVAATVKAVESTGGSVEQVKEVVATAVEAAGEDKAAEIVAAAVKESKNAEVTQAVVSSAVAAAGADNAKAVLKSALENSTDTQAIVNAATEQNVSADTVTEAATDAGTSVVAVAQAQQNAQAAAAGGPDTSAQNAASPNTP